MFWIVSALVVPVIVFLSLCNIYEREGSWCDPEWKRMKMPLWAWMLIALVCLVPILNLCALIVLIIFLMAEIVRDDDYQLRGPIGKFIAWLTKEV